MNKDIKCTKCGKLICWYVEEIKGYICSGDFDEITDICISCQIEDEYK